MKEKDTSATTVNTKLQSLNVYQNNVTCKGVLQLVKLAPNLTYLNLGSNRLEDPGIHALTQLRLLRELNLFQNSFVTFSGIDCSFNRDASFGRVGRFQLRAPSQK